MQDILGEREEAMYILVCAYDGLIDSVEIIQEHQTAIKKAEDLWVKAYAQDDDIKVFDDRGVPKWVPPEVY